MAKIISKNSLFLGEEVEEPLRASYIYGPDGEAIYTCPKCGELATEEWCDCIGSEPDALFCPRCNQEFYRWAPFSTDGPL